jgi:hypothetical protein
MLENLEERIHLKRPKQRWEDNIKFDLTEIEWYVVEWIHLA